MSTWTQIVTSEEVAALKESTSPIVIFKHSNRCSISSMAKSRLMNMKEEIPFNIVEVDVVAHRDLSMAIAQWTGVPHASPQLLLIKDGRVSFETSHFNIREDIVLPAFSS